MELALLALLYFTTVEVPAPGNPVVDLPRAETVEPTRADRILVISMDAEGVIYLGSDRVTSADLTGELSVIPTGERASTRVFLRVHPTLNHSRAMDVMSRLKAEGFDDISLVQGGNGAALEGSMIPKKNED